MTVPVDEHDRFFKSDGFALESLEKIIETGTERVGRSLVIVRVGLDDDHDCAAILLLGETEGLLEEGEVGLVTMFEFGLAIVICIARDVQADEQDVAIGPADIFAEVRESGVYRSDVPDGAPDIHQ